MVSRLSWVAALSALLVLTLSPEGVVRASHSHASKIPVHATLSASSVQPGRKITVDVRTVAGASVQMRVKYSGAGGFTKKAKTGTHGSWTYAWTVRSATPGPASAALTVTKGRQKRHYTLRFTVVAAGATPTATPKGTATVTPTPTAIPRFIIRQANGINSVVDNMTHVAFASTSYTVSFKNTQGTTAGQGNIYLFVLVEEDNEGTSSYPSAPSNFTATNTAGTVYNATSGVPSGATGQPLATSTLAQGTKNVGWIQFEVPNANDTYLLTWNENHTVRVGYVRVNVTKQ